MIKISKHLYIAYNVYYTHNLDRNLQLSTAYPKTLLRDDYHNSVSISIIAD